jgi:hypothetical protein
VFSGLIKWTRSRPLDRLQHASLPQRWTGMGSFTRVGPGSWRPASRSTTTELCRA